jgi:hypothetical protein
LFVGGLLLGREFGVGMGEEVGAVFFGDAEE